MPHLTADHCRHHLFSRRQVRLRHRHGHVAQRPRARQPLVDVSHHASRPALVWRSHLTPSSYRFDVQKDGTFENRKTFAFTDINIPDGEILVLPF